MRTGRLIVSCELPSSLALEGIRTGSSRPAPAARITPPLSGGRRRMLLLDFRHAPSRGACLSIEDPEGDGGSEASDTAEEPFRPNQRISSCTTIAFQLRPSPFSASSLAQSRDHSGIARRQAHSPVGPCASATYLSASSVAGHAPGAGDCERRSCFRP